MLFLAQFYGVELALGQQLMVLLLCVMGGIGAAGVPGGSLPVIAMILGMFRIPAEGIGLILGVDRLLDMCRTTLKPLSSRGTCAWSTRWSWGSSAWSSTVARMKARTAT